MKNHDYASQVAFKFFMSYKDDYQIVAIESIKGDTKLQKEIKDIINSSNFDDIIEYYTNKLIKDDLIDKNFSEDEVRSLIDNDTLNDTIISKILYYQLALIHDIESIDDIRAGLSNAGFDPFLFSKNDWEQIYNMRNIIDF